MTGICASSDYRRSSGQYLDDQTITARVKSALFADPNVSGFQVNVDACRAYLAERLRGYDGAEGEGGRRCSPGFWVRQVQNNLSVREQVNPKR